MPVTASGLEVFDSTIHKTNSWIKDVMHELGTDDRHRGYQVLRAVLHALRDRITIEEVAQLGAQLPMLIRGFYYEGWDPTDKPVKHRHKDEFLARILLAFRTDDDIDPERCARAAFAVLARRISEGEIEDVKHVLPSELQDLWP